jgi:hypothetical protein
MVTKENGIRMLLGVAVFVGTAGVARDANAVLLNVPYVVNGQTLVAESGTAGDAAYFNGKYYFAYIRTDSSIGIVVESNIGTSGQSAVLTSVPGPAVLGPALLALNGTLYLFYVTPGAFGSLEMRRSTNGTTWDGPWFLFSPGSSDPGWSFTTPPVAVAWDGQPVVFATQANSHSASLIVQFNITGTTVTGSSLPGPPFETKSRASATVWQGALYLAWLDQSSNQVGVAHWTDSAGWSAETLTGKSGVPSIYPLDAGSLQMVYRGSDSHIYYSWAPNGVSFGTSYEDTASTTNHQAVQFTDYDLTGNLVFYIGIDSELFVVLE